MKTTQRLLAATKDIWAAYSEHPFVLGLQDGTLNREKFRYYIIQDYLYLEVYAKVFALGIAKAQHDSEAQLRRLEEIFVSCSRYELAFWELAWSTSK